MKKQIVDVKTNLLLSFFVLFVLCGFTSSSSWAAAARTKIIVVVPHRILFTVALPVYIAQDKGFYRENNIDVDAVFTRGGGENVKRSSPATPRSVWARAHWPSLAPS